MRRAELRKTLDGVLVLFSRPDDSDLRDYIQEPNFLYLTGWRDPGAVLMMTASEEILFLPPRNKTSEIFYGRVIDPNDADVFEKTGFQSGAAEVRRGNDVFAADREGAEDLFREALIRWRRSCKGWRHCTKTAT